jgi:hypothetical protein
MEFREGQEAFPNEIWERGKHGSWWPGQLVVRVREDSSSAHKKQPKPTTVIDPLQKTSPLAGAGPCAGTVARSATATTESRP